MLHRLIYFFVLISLVACSPNNVKEEQSLKKHFDENSVTGCFALYNNATDIFTVYNLKRFRDSSYLPASTFKIVNSLIGLQTGVIVNDSMVIPWDGVVRSIPDWNRDLNMYEAFRVSSVPYYQEVARRIGKQDMEYWMDTLGYAAGVTDTAYRIKTKIDSFWLDNSMLITPNEQLGLMKRLYFNQLPFFKKYQETVKRAMLFENNSNYRLVYKTGWGRASNGNQLAWLVGWIEENNHPYLFVLNIETPDAGAAIPAIRMKILKAILKEQGFFEGRM